MLTINLNKSVILIRKESTFTSLLQNNVKLLSRYSTKTGVNLSYRIYGEPDLEPTVLLLHGLLGNKRHWNSIGKTILNVTKKAVVSVDLRNHGDSPHVNSHKYEDLAGDILKLMEKMSIKRASLVGHSMGGRTAMSVSLIAPEKVAGLIVVDISPISTAKHLTNFLPDVLAAMRKMEFKKFKKINEAKKEAKKQLETIIKDDVLMNAILSNIKMTPNHTIGWACNIDILIKYFKYIASFPKSMRRKTYNGPTLFIGGQLSEYLPPDDLPSIREMFPRAVITYVPQTGHNVHAENPKTFLELAIAFLRNNK